MKPRSGGRALALFLAVGLTSCDRLADLVPKKKDSQGPRVAPPTTQPEVKALIDEGRADEALARLERSAPDADTLYWQGVAWAKKAETAPLPTPPPPPSPAVRGAPPPVAPEFKPEELTAVDFFEKALQKRADHAGASLALAELLSPHAARRYAAEQEAAKKPRRGPRPQPTEAPVPEGPDYSPGRIIQLYQGVIQADPTASAPVDSFVRFCLRVGRIEEADGALRELIRRDKEKSEPIVRYGDFLLHDRKEPLLAIEQYRQALMWSPDDAFTKTKIADIYINMGVESYSKLEYAAADARFRDALKYVTDPRSPQAIKVQDYLRKLGSIRKPPAH